MALLAQHRLLGAGLLMMRARLTAIAGFAALTLVLGAVAASTGSARIGHLCQGAHAGTIVGDGEFSEGVINFVEGISCRHALRLVRPRYKQILRLEGEVGEPTGTFSIGGFYCSWEASGPVDVKRCQAGARRFRFL